VVIHVINAYSWSQLDPEKTFNRMVYRIYCSIKGSSWIRPKPIAHIIPPDVGVTTMHLLGSSSGHRQEYGPKPLTTMVCGNYVVSAETRVNLEEL
jgi:hypothetical protein